jgi:hypothetical protein
MKKRSDTVPPTADDYQVGYRRPPKNRQFAPGNSGNPKGRPKGRKNVAAIITEIAMQPMTITEGGRPRKVPRVVAFMLTLWMEAFKGNPRACAAILQHLRDAAMLEMKPEADDQPLAESDWAIIADMLERLPRPSRTGAATTETIQRPEPKAAPKNEE